MTKLYTPDDIRSYDGTKSCIPCAGMINAQALRAMVGVAHTMFHAPPTNQLMICGFFFVLCVDRIGAQRLGALIQRWAKLIL
jgi:hypothetical protein